MKKEQILKECKTNKLVHKWLEEELQEEVDYTYSDLKNCKYDYAYWRINNLDIEGIWEQIRKKDVCELVWFDDTGRKLFDTFTDILEKDEEQHFDNELKEIFENELRGEK